MPFRVKALSLAILPAGVGVFKLGEARGLRSAKGIVGNIWCLPDWARRAPSSLGLARGKLARRVGDGIYVDSSVSGAWDKALGAGSSHF